MNPWRYFLIYCTLLNPALDVIYKTDEFHCGSTLVDTAVSAIPARKGINVARVIKTLGEDVCVTGLIPENDLIRTENFLDDQQISHRFFTIPGNLRINTTILEKNTGAITHLNSLSTVVPRRIQEEYFDLYKQLIVSGDSWCFSGSIPTGFDTDIYGRMVKLCVDNGVASLLDTRGGALKLGIRSRPSMIKPNLSELEEFFEEQIRGVHHIALKGKRLIDMGISYVFISLGVDGMIAIHENDCLLCSAPEANVVDTVGCGDALVAGLLVAQKRNFSFPEMCRIAIACGTSKALHEGPGRVTRDNVWQLMEDVQITSV
jgi:tagatose 6-phosphate kinase